MFVRLTFIQFSKESFKDAKRLYMQEIVPIVRKQKGNINVHLLEPTSNSDDYISITEWESEADSMAYDSSGTYKELVGRFISYFTKPPILKTYSTEDVLIAMH